MQISHMSEQIAIRMSQGPPHIVVDNHRSTRMQIHTYNMHIQNMHGNLPDTPVNYSFDPICV